MFAAFLAPVTVIINVRSKCFRDGAPALRFSTYFHDDDQRSKWLRTTKISPAQARTRRPTTIMPPRRPRMILKSPSHNHRQPNIRTAPHPHRRL